MAQRRSSEPARESERRPHGTAGKQGRPRPRRGPDPQALPARNAADAAGSAPGARANRVTQTFRVRTPHGEAQVDLDRPRGAVGLLVLGHGASGGVDAPDLVAVRDAAVAAGFAVARVTQPYRLAGRRAPAPETQLDAAFVAAVADIRRRVGAALPVVVGGRSSGARVAARTAVQVGAAGVLALAFPLHPPGKPEKSRASELDPAVPTLVINGDADPFGVPAPTGAVQVEVRPGERHDLRRDPTAVATSAVAWLTARFAG